MISGWEDPELTAAGRGQAEAVAEGLAGEEFDGVWSSDLRRTRQTAALAWGKEVSPDHRLRELNFGVLEGRVWRELPETTLTAMKQFESFVAEGGESTAQLGERLLSFLSELSPGRHLVFTHGGVIHWLLCRFGDAAWIGCGQLVKLDIHLEDPS
jgi:probable phosphoglycerate mutase